VRRMLIGAALLLLAPTAACSSTASTPTTAASAPAAPTPAASTAAAPPSAAEDAANVKKALVDAVDLGKPWIAPKSVSRSGGKEGEICPGHVSALRKVTFTADASTDLTEGKGVGKNIASYELRMLSDEDVTALADAVQADDKACAKYQDASGFRVVRTAEGPTTVANAPLVASWAERVYYVKPHKLAYARHYLVARQGRVVTTLGYAFLATKKDPGAKDFAAASRLLQVQLDKNARVLGS
jgi:hypothetical protein